ncbi:MAG: phosphatase PAP2 family protein, partial [Eudoraea sp.]|nr:phosphatase PAP2 family protein [Eudoraea sp.]
MRFWVLAICFLGLTSGSAQYSPKLNQYNSFKQTKQLQFLPATNIDFTSDFNTDKTLGYWESTNTYASQPFMLNSYWDSTAVKQKWYKTDTGASLLVAGGLITAGTIMHFNNSFKVGVRDDINRYLPEFDEGIDDITQYVPVAAVFALDAAGVRSQHSQMRKLTTLATMTATGLVVINGLKYSISEPRPDGSSNNAFPSGHTTVAFMGAHMFHKEYKHKSPFYSITAYALATFTGVLRQLNNRHWISDVTAGAGLGIATTEFSYFLNERWWKEKGINEIAIIERKINESKPSFLGVKMAYASLLRATANENIEPLLSANNGYRITAEGAYFFNKNFGIGGELGFQSFPQEVDPRVIQEVNAAGFELHAQAMGSRMQHAGAYYQIPFGKNAIGTKLLLGLTAGTSSKVFAREPNQVIDDPENQPQEFVYADYKPKPSFSWATGLYYNRILSKNIGIGVYADFNWA